MSGFLYKIIVSRTKYDYEQTDLKQRVVASYLDDDDYKEAEQIANRDDITST